MLRAILFDLDDTLLGNPTERFFEQYIRKLTAYTQEQIPSERLLPALLSSAQQLMTHSNPNLSNLAQFWENFIPQINISLDIVEPIFQRFYETEFEELKNVTQFRPEAVDLVNWCHQQGWQLVVATNPVFPASAIYARLAWAGLPADTAPFTTITTMENSHYAKPHPGYYHEILQKISCQPADVLMVGDDWQNDMLPSQKVGCHTFWVTQKSEPLQPDCVDRFGSLTKLHQLLLDGWLQ